MISGLINLDKPPGITSARAVAVVKRLLPRGTKIGHAGTLDPFATGVLLLLIGKATKLCETLMSQPKQYEATIRFGATTPTDDPESPEETRPNIASVAQNDIRAALPHFIGAIQQQPPAFSALRVGGRRAYDLARTGQPLNLKPRTVHVYNIELLNYAWPHLKLRIDCGRGTYIRSIARDLGEVLGVGGHLRELRRMRVGAFTVADAISLDQLRQDGIERHLIPTDISEKT